MSKHQARHRKPDQRGDKIVQMLKDLKNLILLALNGLSNVGY